MDITPDWTEIIEDLTWAIESGERFPGEVDASVMDWARGEIRRIGEHLGRLPDEHRLAPPDEARHGELLDALGI